MSGKSLPNLLFLMADQHRYDCVGKAGLYPISTPNMDRLAQDGAFFRNAFTPMPICAPAAMPGLWAYGGQLWRILEL